MNGTKFSSVLDGFGRFSNVQFNNGRAHFTSKMIKSSFYKQSLQERTIAPSVLFAETIQPRWKSMIPTLNFSQGFPTDNNWVSLELMADNKTFVGTNDSNKRLEIDLLTMDVRRISNGWVTEISLVEFRIPEKWLMVQSSAYAAL